ncbi:SigE family RNA polymerase sigma factor [Micromonospora sp. NPDC092111]|uniref:SigE family RNA polymerase sigma factor n=1 Tax=Micromonospora sp. NPDC092111 TaxID=3364289 RepID=UPI00380C088D
MADRDPLEEEFRDFVAARSGALLRTAYLLAGDWATAEDLLQTALTKTYLAWRRLGGIDAVEPYARRVLVNTATSWWRRRWHGERPTEVLPERAGVDEIEQQLDRDALWRHLRALPARQRAVLVLRYYEDLSEAQTAALLEISPGTVKSQTSRALATLRRRMGGEALLDLTTEADARPAALRRPQTPGRAAPQPAPGRATPRATPERATPRPTTPERATPHPPTPGRAAPVRPGPTPARAVPAGRIGTGDGPAPARPVGTGARPATTPVAAETR